jgi:hypothetical protein
MMKARETNMTNSLRRVFDEAAKLSDQEQEVLAERLLAELAVEDDFDRAIANSGEKLAKLARAALAEDQAGLTRPLEEELP